MSSPSESSVLLLHGLVHRSLRHTIESIRKNVIAPLKRSGPVEIYFHCWDVAEVYNPRANELGGDLNASVIGELLPEAKGVIEQQEDYIQTLDWENLIRRNPMRYCTNGEEAAALTLRNFLVALESQQRAWRVFERHRMADRYHKVVASRADLRFLDELGVRRLENPALAKDERRRTDEEKERGKGDPPTLWVPRFHAWGGVNDRFAIGNEDGIRIWSHRLAFAEEWLKRAQRESAEWLLMKWLEKNRVRVGFMDFTFQRIRANGLVAERDRELRASTHTSWTSSTPERFLVLARESGGLTEYLIQVLKPHGKVEVIVDCPPSVSKTSESDEVQSIYLTDEEAAGFSGLMSTSSPFPVTTAWSRAFAHLARTVKEDEAVWIVEDDVAADMDSFAALVRATRAKSADLSALDVHTRHEDPHWWWWNYADGFFANPCRAFQPLCRLSSKLLRVVLDFQMQQQRFTFHEVLFASLAHEHGMTTLDWRKVPSIANMLEDFRYRPYVSRLQRGVLHPVKDQNLHHAICGQPSAGANRRNLAACEGWSILQDDYDFLAVWCRKQGFRFVVEFGPGDSTLALLDAGCRVLSYEHDIAWLRKTLDRFQDETKVEIVHCPEGCLPDPPAEVPDLVFVDGPPFRNGQTMSRLGPCEWALQVCGCFLLHDAFRQGELATLAEMERRGMEVTRIATQKGLAWVVDPKVRPELTGRERSILDS